MAKITLSRTDGRRLAYLEGAAVIDLGGGLHWNELGDDGYQVAMIDNGNLYLEGETVPLPLLLLPTAGEELTLFIGEHELLRSSDGFMLKQGSLRLEIHDRYGVGLIARSMQRCWQSFLDHDSSLSDRVVLRSFASLELAQAPLGPRSRASALAERAA